MDFEHADIGGVEARAGPHLQAPAGRAGVGGEAVGRDDPDEAAGAEITGQPRGERGDGLGRRKRCARDRFGFEQVFKVSG